MQIEILLKQIRHEKKVTLTKLSDRSGVSVSHISDIENNYKMPSLLVSVKLAKALDVEITELYKVTW
ncbi:MAG: helix-turn-helix transcriptional regulator [Clostridia bacterium]|nr:helix-turn-helix transcriptional regulator [Clostridia bacterium]